jgi:hypothetical protein
VASTREANESTSQNVDGETFISWGVRNLEDTTVFGQYFVDVYYDGLVVNRWQGSSLRPRVTSFAADWPGLADAVQLTPGVHVLKLVVDSTNLIQETDETDNVFEMEVVWQSGEPTPVPERPVTRLPDLAVVPPVGALDPIFATSYLGDVADGPLSLDVMTYIVSAFENRGLSSVTDLVRVDLYYDDILVDWRLGDGAIAGSASTNIPWPNLPDFVRLTSGPHTLKMVIDANDLIAESDETNNVFEKEFVWDTGPVDPKPLPISTPTPTLPQPLSQSNLQPGWIFNSDGPIVLSGLPNARFNSALVVGQDVFLGVAVKNQSSMGTRIPFGVEIYFDDKLVDTLSFRGGAPAQSIVSLEWGGLVDEVDIDEGEHTVKIVIDPANSVREANEDDNVFETTFEWFDEAPAPLAPTVYSSEEISELLTDLRALVDSSEVSISDDGIDHTERIIDIVDAGYYLMTGTSLRDEPVEILVLSRANYVAWINEEFENQFAAAGANDIARVYFKREKLKELAVGFTTRRLGRLAVVIDGERPIPNVIDTLAHEVGHMRQDLLNPEQQNATAFDPLISGLLEAQAQQFQRTIWLALEDFTGQTFLSYPDARMFRESIAQRVDVWIRGATQDEHLLGYLLMWLAVTTVPELEVAATELRDQGILSTQASLDVYNYLVGLSPRNAQNFVRRTYGRTTSAGLLALFNLITSVAEERLVPDLHPDDEGLANLKTVGLLSP